MDNLIEVVLKVLNEAVAADAAAVERLVTNRIPCNKTLADHPTILVSESKTQAGIFHVGFLGVLNGILEQACGQRIAVMVEQDEDQRLVGFCLYPKPLKPASVTHRDSE